MADGSTRVAWRCVWRKDQIERFATWVDATTGAILLTEPLFLTDGTGRVFDPNPVTKLNDPTLQDDDDAASAVPDSAYSIVTLPGLAPAGRLHGPYVQLIDRDAPTTAPADAAQPLMFDRSDDRFEEVMTYFHIDRSQRYLQSLGYMGVRQIVPYALPVDAHAVGGDDNSFYVWDSPGKGALYFGDGGVDDAEDPDIVMHEYGHAIQDSIAPGVFTGSYGSESRALGEAFGDYWAFSSGYQASLAYGRDPFCIGDWDARCGNGPSSKCDYPPGADCLRRVDGTKTMADYIHVDQPGVEHRNGEIWSSALREIFLGMAGRLGVEEGRREADRLMLESQFGSPSGVTFAVEGKQLLTADSLLYQGRDVQTICGALTARGILSADDCVLLPRGEFTLFQGDSVGVAIPPGSGGASSGKSVTDSRAVDAVRVEVAIRDANAGTLQITLTSPSGKRVVLQKPGQNPGGDLHLTFGLDVQPAESLDAFRGELAAGEWTLDVTDTSGTGGGELLYWSLLLAFEGEAPVSTRGGDLRWTIPVVGHADGANGTHFVSDLRIFNPAALAADLTLFFTPAGRDGTREFGAVRVVVAGGETVSLDDVVARELRTTGLGALDLRSDRPLLVTSRTYDDTPEGTLGQSIPPADHADSIASGDGILEIPGLRNTGEYRSNIGFAETSGGPGEITVTVLDSAGIRIWTQRITIAPWSQLQLPLLGGSSGAMVEGARVEAWVSNGTARVVGYGSVVDNRSGDAIFVPGRREGATSSRIPVVVHTDGAEGTHWRSDVRLTNPGGTPAEAALTFFPATGGAPVVLRRSVGAGAAIDLDDVVPLFG
ncbi:MAG: proprotein convertase P-domain-containing protein, partial [Thermoanaerobaculia bacterium]